jgi:hypothetical protein
MDHKNYIPKNFSVCSVTRRKVQSLPKDRARKIQGYSKIPSLKSTLNFYKNNETHRFTDEFFFVII